MPYSWTILWNVIGVKSLIVDVLTKLKIDIKVEFSLDMHHLNRCNSSDVYIS